MSAARPARPSWPARLAWFIGLWVASVAALGLIAFALRWVLKP